jgi:exodeoxyribonuclease VII small subunit
LAEKQKSGNQIAREPTFEEALEQIEQIVRRLEQGEIGLSEALQQYEKGVKLLRRCYDLLQGVERRIEMLRGIDPQGNPISTPMGGPTPSSGQGSRERSRSGEASEAPYGEGRPGPDTDMDAPAGFS